MNIATLKAVVTIEDRDFQAGRGRVKDGFRDVNREADDASRSLSGLDQKLDTLGSAFTKLGIAAGAAAIGAKVKDFAKDSIDAASDLSESISKVNVVFGANAKEIQEWSKTAAGAFGQSRQEALEATGTLGNLFTSMKIGRQEASQMSRSLVVLAGDLASFNNVKPEEALLALRSGLVGETEPLRRFGVNLNEASLKAEALRMGLIRGKEDLTASMKAQAAYNLIFQQTTNAQGDFARTADGVANKTRIAEATFKDLKAEIGEELLPLWNELLSRGIDLLKFFKDLPEPVRNTAVIIGLSAGIMAPGIVAFTNLVGLIKDLRDLTKGGAVANGVKGIATAAATSATGQAIGGAAGAAANRFGYTAADLAAMSGTGAAGARVGLGARLLGGAKAVASRAALPITIAASAITLGDLASRQWDRRNGVESPGLMESLDTFNPWSNRAAREDAANRARMEEFRKARATGQSPAQLAQREARERAQAATSTQTALSQEEQDKQRKALIAANDAAFAAQTERVKSTLVTTPEGQRARAELKALSPLIEREKQYTRELAEDTKRRTGETAEYHQLVKQYHQLEGEQRQLALKAGEEEREQVTRAQKEARELNNRRYEIMLQQARTVAEGAQEGERAQAELRALEPVIRRRMDDLSREARDIVRSGRRDGEAQREYLEREDEYWKLAQDIQRLRGSAANETRQNIERARREQEKAAEEQKRAQEDAERARLDAAREQQDIAGARVGLLEARLRNVPGLSDEERNRLMIPELQRQRKAMMQGLPGERESDRLRRETDVAGIEGRILEAMGLLGNGRGGRGGGGRGGNGPGFATLIGGAMMPLMPNRMMFNPEMRWSMGGGGRMGGGSNATIIIQAPNPEQRKRRLMEAMDNIERDYDPGF